MAVARAAARSQSERAFALVLDRLLVDTGASHGRLVGFDPAGRVAVQMERGPLEEARAASALEQAAALDSPRAEGDGLAIPLRLLGRRLGAAVLEGAAGVDPAVVAEASARAAVGVGNGL